jgi:hypothetical protein
MIICAPHDGKVDLPLKGGFVARAGTPYQEMTYATLRPGICLAAQGAKQTMLGQNLYPCDPSGMYV